MVYLETIFFINLSIYLTWTQGMSSYSIYISRLYVIIALCLTCCGTAEATKIPPVFEHTTSSKAKRASKHSSKPVFAYIYTEWSIPSMRMLDSTFTDAKVINELSSDYETVAIDGSKKKKFKSEYDIHIYPTMLVMDLEGKLDQIAAT